MNPLAHALSGLNMLVIAHLLFKEAYSSMVIFVPLTFVFSTLPDYDSFWKKCFLSYHHQSLFHAPLFWLAMSLLILVVELLLFKKFLGFAFLLFLSTQFHLFTDYITARCAGISWFYPFNKKEASLFKIKPELGLFDFLRSTKSQKKPYKNFYKQNNFLVLFEIGVSFLGVFFFVLFFLL
jgi:hypothetical protein